MYNEIELILANLMRGLVARANQLNQVEKADMVTLTIVPLMVAFSAYFVVVLSTWFAIVMGLCFYGVAINVAANRGFLLRRKWWEFESLEKDAQTMSGAMENPSIEKLKRNQIDVGITGGVAIGGAGLPLILYGWCQIWTLGPNALFNLAATVYTAGIIGYGVYAMLQAAKPITEPW